MILDWLSENWVIVAAYLGGLFSPIFIPSFFNFLLGRSIERYKLRLLQTQKADRIAELFAFMPLIAKGESVSRDEMLRINQLLLELSIYLPRDLVCELSQTVCKKQGEYKKCLILIREYILYGPPTFFQKIFNKMGKRGDGLISDNISHLDP